MTNARLSGLLLHPTSLPSPHGIGDIGQEAHEFARFLGAAGQRLWQMLPTGPTGYGDSPYQSFSSFAGNPLLIDLRDLAVRGLLAKAELDALPHLPASRVDYGAVIPAKTALLRLAARRFVGQEPPSELAAYRARHADWLPDFALFMACKDAHGGRAWTSWDADIRDRQPQAMERWKSQLRDEVRLHEAWQYLFALQWETLKERCRERGVQLMGDVPIYVAHDSADVWSHPELFKLDATGNPTHVAGVPPDYFSATGQLWGNPIYHWTRHHETGYAWWIQRLRAAFAQFDLIRLDHFRGFEAFWQVPGGEVTAVNGEWVDGPKEALFAAAEQALGRLPLVAENLGVITPAVEAIRERFGFPGMSVLQFAFGTDPQAPTFRPHNYPRHVVAYTGTHDNDTTVGWWTSTGSGDSTRTAEEIEEERMYCLRYLHADGREIQWDFIRALMASVAETVIVPVQDVLGLGSEARMNQPATMGTNWQWRTLPGALTAEHAARLRQLVMTYERI